MTGPTNVPDEVMELVRKFPDDERRRKLFSAAHAELLEKHPYHWVALLEGDIWVLADTFEGLWAKIDAQGLDRGSAIGGYLDPHPPTIKL